MVFKLALPYNAKYIYFSYKDWCIKCLLKTNRLCAITQGQDTITELLNRVPLEASYYFVGNCVISLTNLLISYTQLCLNTTFISSHSNSLYLENITYGALRHVRIILLTYGYMHVLQCSSDAEIHCHQCYGWHIFATCTLAPTTIDDNHNCASQFSKMRFLTTVIYIMIRSVGFNQAQHVRHRPYLRGTG